MVYSETITVTANRAKVDAVDTSLKVTKGLVWKIEVDFPPGCCGLTHVQVFDGSYQLFPASPGDSLHGDGAVIAFDDSYLKDAAPFSFIVKTWNLDTIWDHTIQVRIGMASAEAFMSRYMPSITWEKFQQVMAQTAVQQEYERVRQIEQLAKELGEV